MATARNQAQTSATSTTPAKTTPAKATPTKTTAAKPESAAKAGATSKPGSAAKAGSAPKTGDVKASKTSKTSPSAYTVTIPVDQLVSATVGATVSVAKIPVAVVRRVVPTKGGLPVYLGLGGLAVVGAVEWPVAAAAGAGFAALRRWGPLRPAAAEEAPVVETVTATVTETVVEEEGK